MYFDFEDRYEEYEPIGGRLGRRDGVFLSVGVHVVVLLTVLFAPALPFLRPDPAKVAAVEPPKPQERPRFVFVKPRVDLEAPKPPKRADESDKHRVARSEAPRLAPANELPASRGNSPERTEATREERSAGKGPAPTPSTEPPAPEVAARAPEPVPEMRTDPSLAPLQRPRPPQGGSLGDALRNLQKYVDQQNFNNDKGQVQNLGPLQFDTKGVEFGPWIRRFIAQVRRNWFVPYAAMSLRGHVVLTFNVHRNGALTDVQVIQPSSIDSFNTAAMNALLASNPTEPLPPEYPADKAFFTVTFYYNESPGGQ